MVALRNHHDRLSCDGIQLVGSLGFEIVLDDSVETVCKQTEKGMIRTYGAALGLLAVADDVADDGDCILFEPEASDVFEPILLTGVADLNDQLVP